MQEPCQCIVMNWTFIILDMTDINQIGSESMDLGLYEIHMGSIISLARIGLIDVVFPFTLSGSTYLINMVRSL